MKQLFTIGLLTLTTLAYSQRQKNADIASIKSMCGCYEIEFNFAETFSPQKDYEYHDNYKAGALEYVFAVEESKDKVVLQHLLIVGDSMIVKHWRQDWLYENTNLYTFDQNNTWNYQALDPKAVKGQWTQKVYQVDDSPRYEASGTWIHADGKNYWESDADAPLPRREHSKRSDYNVMVRKNRQEITDYGWLHEQDNQKVIRTAENDELLAWEKGWNTYTKTADSKCNVAKEWWADNNHYWADVRAVWDELFQTKETIAINMKVEDKVLFQRLFALGKEVNKESYNSEIVKNQIREAIRLHLKNEKLLALK